MEIEIRGDRRGLTMAVVEPSADGGAAGRIARMRAAQRRRRRECRRAARRAWVEQHIWPHREKLATGVGLAGVVGVLVGLVLLGKAIYLSGLGAVGLTVYALGVVGLLALFGWALGATAKGE